VNGTPVTEQVLMPGDQFTVAQQYHYRLEYVVAPRTVTSGPIRWLVLAAIAAGLGLATWSIWSQLAG
jgi:hypothetical protein